MKKIFNFISFLLIFIAPIIIVIQRYETSESEKTVTVESGLGFIPTMIISIILFVGVLFLVSNFKEMIKKKPFGTLSIATYSIVMGTLVFLAWIWVRNIANAAQSNLEAFTTSFEYHEQTLYIIMIFIGVGLLLLFWEQMLSVFKKMFNIIF